MMYCVIDGCAERATRTVELSPGIDMLVCSRHAPEDAPYANEPPDAPPTWAQQPRDDGGHFQPLQLDPWGRPIVWAD